MLPPMLCGDDLAVLDQGRSEVRADGFRAQLHPRPAALWSRAGKSLASAFPEAVDAARSALPDVDAVLDCELVVVDDTARPRLRRRVRPRRMP